jgi:L-alanine-DL-glutamate epimerase-like enolase superfamily enzyme
MSRKLSVTHESWPLKKIFTISRGSKASADTVYVEIAEGNHVGRGESVPYKRYGETISTVISQIMTLKNSIESGMNSEELLIALEAGAARNAIDCALWDLQSKVDNIPVWKRLNKHVPSKITSAMTIGMETPAIMAADALEYNKYDVLKLKLGSQDVIESVRAIRCVAPNPKLIIDANEAWNEKQIRAWQEELFDLNVSLIEQPLPVGKDGCLNDFNHLIPICADESCHTAKDIPQLTDKYDYVNLKLDKTGGLTEALRAKEQALLCDLGLMIGCMVATSLSMAPAILLTENADFIDLDGPFLLDMDRQPSLIVGSNCLVYNSDIWG